MDSPPVDWNEALSPFDYMMFRADMDRRSRTSMMWIETLDLVPDRARFRETLERASRTVPRLRQHVVAPLVPLAPPRWVTDPDFDLDYHVRWIALPAPGDFRHLLDLAQTLHAAPLDLGRPLWEVTVIEGLTIPGAPAALCWKLSHTVTDGVGGMVLDSMIRTVDRDPDLGPMPPVPVPEDVTPLELTRKAVHRLPISLVRGSVGRIGAAAGLLGRVVGDPTAAAKDVAAVVGDVRKLAGGAAAAPSPVLQRRGLNRRFEALEVPLASLRAAAKTQQCSVNDAYLAALGGALRRYHEALGVPVDTISVGMPINLRTAGDGGAGNQWAAAVLAVPVSEADPAKRMRQVRQEVLTARTGSSIEPTQLIAPVLAWLPQQLLAGLGAGGLGIDIQASNVPGHPSARHIAGAKVLRSVPIGPLPGVALMATMVSVSGMCGVGVNYDTASITDFDLFATCLQQGFDEVVALGVPPAPSKKAVEKKPTTTARKKAAPRKRNAAGTKKRSAR